MTETNREATCDNDYTGIANREDGTGYMTNEYDAPATQKQYTSDVEYGGNINSSLNILLKVSYNLKWNDRKLVNLVPD